MTAKLVRDPSHFRRIECARLEARVQGRCSECDRRISPSQMDSSARCDECRP